MKLEGSCHCGKVKFRVESETPYPFMFCYCSICRKTTGAITSNIMGVRKTLRVTGEKHLAVYHAVIRNPGVRSRRSEAERWFCKLCGTHLYLLDESWPDGVWPNAASIDTELPVPPSHVHLMTRYKRDWVPLDQPGPRFPEYPDLSIDEWHQQMGLKQPITAAPRRRSPAKARAKKRKG